MNHSSYSSFLARKQQVISSLVEALDSDRRDKSPKGFIDAPILDLMHVVNSHPDYYTTSSCSGRIAIYCEGLDTTADSEEKTTKGGVWLYVTHDPVDIPDQADDTWILKLLFGDHQVVLPAMQQPADANTILRRQMIYFKFEPMILHVEASTQETAMHLNGLAFKAGYQNSGITPSKRHMLAIRSTHKLDAPVAYVDPATQKVHCLVDPAYLNILLRLSNEKFAQNAQRLKLFEDMMREEVKQTQLRKAAHIETKEERRERKRQEGLARQRAALQEAKEPREDIQSDIEDINLE